VNASASMLASGPQLDNRRVAAAVIDVLLLLPLVGALYILCDGVGPAFIALSFAWMLFYFFAFESGDGQTPGKRLLGLRVLSGDGRPADMRSIAVRTALRVIDLAVGFLVMSATRQRRARLGDLAAGTMVVDARAAASPVSAATATAEPEVVAPAADAPTPVAEPEAPAPEDMPAEATRFMGLGADAWAPVAEPAHEPEEPAAEEEPVAEQEPAPVVELSPEPVIEPVAEQEPAPVVELSREPVIEPEPEEEPAPVVELSREPVLEPEVVVEPPVDDEAPMLEPSIRRKLAEPVADEPDSPEMPSDDDAWRVVETPSAELDPTDPEQWMAAQREQADSEEPVAEPEQSALQAPDANLLVHPDEEEPRQFL
jgi:uncharacterized RDD family membrane protein YckC